MTDEQRTTLESLGCTITVSYEGEDWTSLHVEGEGISVYILDEEEAAQQLIDGLKVQVSDEELRNLMGQSNGA